MTACPPCDLGHQHEYDDDHPFDNDWLRGYFRDIGDISSVGDPCVWCDHSKCAQCPPMRPLTGGSTPESDSGPTDNAPSVVAT